MKTKKASAKNGIPFKPCSIKMLPREKWEKAAETAAAHNPMNRPAINQLMRAIPNANISAAHLAVLHTKYWGIGGVKLTVGFLDPATPALKKKILSHMNAWGKYCNVKFTPTNSTAQVRISFSTPPPNDGYWSYLGTDILEADASEPTMNLDSFSMTTPDSEFYRVIRHETGHTLGFPHEHLRAEIINKMDKEKAIALFMQTQGWTRQQVIDQVLTPIPNSALTATAQADPQSIMCYQLPAQIMNNGQAVPGGTDIDPMDKKFAASVYPKKKN
jgi:hypothetical protein